MSLLNFLMKAPPTARCITHVLSQITRSPGCFHSTGCLVSLDELVMLKTNLSARCYVRLNVIQLAEFTSKSDVRLIGQGGVPENQDAVLIDSMVPVSHTSQSPYGYSEESNLGHGSEDLGKHIICDGR